MREVIDLILLHARSVWRYRWYIHLVAVPICLAGWALVATLPNKYESSASVYVDTRSMLKPLLRGLTVESDVESDVAHITQTLFTRENLEKIARMADMDLKADNERQLDAILNRLKGSVSLTRRMGKNIYVISYESDDPAEAKRVVDAVMTLFVESALGGARKDTSTAEKFLSEQIKEYETRLTDAEEKVEEFKRKNIEFLPRAGVDYFSKLQQSKAEYSEAKLLLEEATKKRDEISRQMQGEEPTFGIVPFQREMKFDHPLDARIAQLETQLDELLLRYTARHPDVEATQETINRLKKKRDEDLKELQERSKGSNTYAGPDSSPVYQQLKISLGRSEAEVAALTVRVNQLAENVNKLEQMVDTVPKIEAELQRLNRDYSINKENYELLLARRESAALSRQADQSADEVKFKVIDVPRLPTSPSSPNRMLFNAVVLIGGFAAGIVLAILLAQIKPTFDSQRYLSEFTKLPVYGAISIVRTASQIKMRLFEVVSFFVVMFMILLTFGMVFIFQSQLVHLLGGNAGSL